MFRSHLITQAIITLLLTIGHWAFANLTVLTFVNHLHLLCHPLLANVQARCSSWLFLLVDRTVLDSSPPIARVLRYRPRPRRRLRNPVDRCVAVNHLFGKIHSAFQRCSTVLASILAITAYVILDIPIVIRVIFRIYFSIWLAFDSMLAFHLAGKERTGSRPCSASDEGHTVIRQLREDLEATKQENKALKAEKAASCIWVAGVRRVMKLQKARITALKTRLRVQKAKGYELEVVKGRAVELQAENQGLKEEKVSMKEELHRLKQQVEVTKAGNQQLDGDLQSAKKTVENLTAQVIETNASKADEHTKRLAAESEVTTLRAQVSSLGMELKEAKMARVVDLLVLKKEREGKATEKADAEKAKQEHAQEIKDLRLQLVETQSSANSSALELEAAKQDKAAIEEELTHNVTLIAANTDFQQQVHELQYKLPSTAPIAKDDALDVNTSFTDEAEADENLESLETLKNYFAAKDVGVSRMDVATTKAEEEEEDVSLDHAEDTLLNENSDGHIIVEANLLKDGTKKEDSKTTAEDCSSTVKDHSTPPVVPTTVKDEPPALDRQKCTSGCELVLPLPQASSPITAVSPSELTMTANTDAAIDLDVSSTPPQRKSRPRRRRGPRRAGQGANAVEIVAVPTVPTLTPTSNRRRRTHRPWFYQPKA